MGAKAEALRAIGELPEESTIEDAIERLYLLSKVRRGIADADAGRTLSQEEARAKMAKWLK